MSSPYQLNVAKHGTVTLRMYMYRPFSFSNICVYLKSFRVETYLYHFGLHHRKLRYWTVMESKTVGLQRPQPYTKIYILILQNTFFNTTRLGKIYTYSGVLKFNCTSER